MNGRLKEFLKEYYLPKTKKVLKLNWTNFFEVVDD